MGERLPIRKTNLDSCVETEREIMPRCVVRALSPLPEWVVVELEKRLDQLPGTPNMRVSSLRIIGTSIYRFVRSLETLLSMYHLTFSKQDISSAWGQLMVRWLDDPGYLKRRLTQYSSVLFPQIDQKRPPSFWRFVSGRLGDSFKAVSRRIANTANLDERASFALGVAKLSHALIQGDVPSIIRAHDKLVQRVEPPRSEDIESELMSSIADVVKEVYPRRSFKEPHFQDMSPNNSSLHYKRNTGMTYGLMKDFYGPLSDSELFMMRPSMEMRGGRVVHQEERILFPTQMDFVADFPLDPCHGVSVMHLCMKGKVRTVTKGSEYDNLNVHRVQGSFFRPIHSYPTFHYTQEDVRSCGAQFSRLDMLGGQRVPPELDLYISGDFDECTDRFSAEWTKFTIEQICLRIGVPLDHIPKLFESVTEWAWPGNGTTPDTGYLGQPQGHGLSFPVLCVINAALFKVAFKFWLDDHPDRKKWGSCELKDLPVMINGDDIVFRGDQRLYDIWVTLAAMLGLKVSDSKTFRSRTHFVLNSRAFNGDSLEACNHVMAYLSLPKESCSVWSYDCDEDMFKLKPLKRERESLSEIADRVQQLFKAVHVVKPGYAMFVEDRVIRNAGIPSYVHRYAHHHRGGIQFPLLPGRLSEYSGRTRIIGAPKTKWTQEEKGYLRFFETGPENFKDLILNSAPGTAFSPVERLINGVYGKVWERGHSDPLVKLFTYSEIYARVRAPTWNTVFPREGLFLLPMFDDFYRSDPLPRSTSFFGKKGVMPDYYLSGEQSKGPEEVALSVDGFGPVRIW